MKRILGPACPSCGGESSHYRSQRTANPVVLRRRRRCLGCGFRWRTLEKPDRTDPPFPQDMDRKYKPMPRDANGRLIPRDKREATVKLGPRAPVVEVQPVSEEPERPVSDDWRERLARTLKPRKR